MSETSTAYMQNQTRPRLSWLALALFRPGQTFTHLFSQRRGGWQLPMLALTLAVLLNTLAAGWLNQKAAMAGEIPLPPDFQYWMPEQQEQYMLSQQVRQGPVFHYVIPSIAALSGAWLGWLLVGGMLHLAMTLLGGRGETGVTMNLVAWASLPLALRQLVQAAYHLIAQKTIAYSGLSGFIDPASEGVAAFLGNLLALVDVYLIWHILLLILGVRIYTHLSRGKAALGVFIVIGLVLLAQAAFGYLLDQVSQLAIIRPYFF